MENKSSLTANVELWKLLDEFKNHQQEEAIVNKNLTLKQAGEVHKKEIQKQMEQIKVKKQMQAEQTKNEKAELEIKIKEYE